MNPVAAGLFLLGAIFLAVAGMSASTAPNVSYMAGTFLPGVVCVIIGLKLSQGQKPSATALAGDDAASDREIRLPDQSRADAFKFNANLGVGCGIPLMFLGSGITNRMEGGISIGLPIFLGGFALEIWGCVNYMRWKGRSGWLGLFGYLLLPGLLILACFANRRKQAIQNHGPESHTKIEELATEDRKSAYPYLFALTPVGLFGIILGGLVYSVGSSIDPAQWKEVDSKDVGFQALMPGTPRLVHEPKETPAGKIELHKFIVEPTGKKEMFMILSVRFPESVADNFGGPEKLLEVGRQDVLDAVKGQVQSEKRIVLNGHPGLELEVLPPKGAIVKAQIFATKTQIFEVWVHVPQIRLASEDVQKFFDSFKLTDDAGAPPDGIRRPGR